MKEEQHLNPLIYIMQGCFDLSIEFLILFSRALVCWIEIYSVDKAIPGANETDTSKDMSSKNICKRSVNSSKFILHVLR